MAEVQTARDRGAVKGIFRADRKPIGSVNRGWWIHLVLMMAVAASSLYPIILASNPNIPLSYDQAEYVGAARDFLETGSFLESTHSQSLGVNLPLGYPVLIVLATKLLGTTPHLAALQINLAAGVLLTLLIYLLVWRMTTNMAWSFLAGLAAAGHWQLVFMASRAMTDTLYSCLFTILALLTITYFGRSKTTASPLILGGISGLLVGVMYLIRVSAVFLIPGLPALWLILNCWKRKLAWSRLVMGMMLFILLTGLASMAVSWRFQQVNGVWSLSPQISFNARMGSFKAGQDNKLWTVDESGDLVIKRANALEGETGLQALAGQFNVFVVNLRENLLSMKRMLLSSDMAPPDYWLALAVLLAASLLSGWRRPTPGAGREWPRVDILAALQLSALAFTVAVLLAHPRTYRFTMILLTLVWVCWTVGRRSLQDHQCKFDEPGSFRGVGLVTTATLCAMHILAYSLLNWSERYVAQTLPLALALVVGLMSALLPRFNPGQALAGIGRGRDIGPAAIPANESPLGSQHGPAQAGCPDLGGGRKTGPPAAVAWRTILGGLVGFLVIFLLADSLLFLGNVTLRLAKARGAVTADSPGGVDEAGETIHRLARESGQQARVAQGDSGVAFYAHGQGYIVPYLETRPDRLLHYLNRHQINFVSCTPVASFGEVHTGIGLYHLMAALDKGGYPGVESHGEGLVFQVRPRLTLRLVAQGSSFPPEGLTLEAEGYYLLWLKLHGPPLRTTKSYKRVNTSPVRMLELRRNVQTMALAANPLCAGPSLLDAGVQANKTVQLPDAELTYYHVLSRPRFPDQDAGPWRLALSPQAPAEFKAEGYSLYAITSEAPVPRP